MVVACSRRQGAGLARSVHGSSLDRTGADPGSDAENPLLKQQLGKWQRQLRVTSRSGHGWQHGAEPSDSAHQQVLAQVRRAVADRWHAAASEEGEFQPVQVAGGKNVWFLSAHHS